MCAGSGNKSFAQEPMSTWSGIVPYFPHITIFLEIDEENLTITVPSCVITRWYIKRRRKKVYFIHQIKLDEISTSAANINENSGGITRPLIICVNVELCNGALNLSYQMADIYSHWGGKFRKDGSWLRF